MLGRLAYGMLVVLGTFSFALAAKWNAASGTGTPDACGVMWTAGPCIYFNGACICPDLNSANFTETETPCDHWSGFTQC